jgi:hypothetical protein
MVAGTCTKAMVVVLRDIGKSLDVENHSMGSMS